VKISRLLHSVPLLLLLVVCGGSSDCDGQAPTSDQIQSAQQERILQEGTNQVGMPAIKNFRERKLLKEILEKRDQEGFLTYTYVWREVAGGDASNNLVFLCNSIGYGIPYATQFTNPQKRDYAVSQVGVLALPQADPNGLFSPATAEGTWVMCKNPHGPNVEPVYIEPRIVVSPFPLTGKPSP
jgi:hypothetical protein